MARTIVGACGPGIDPCNSPFRRRDNRARRFLLSVLVGCYSQRTAIPSMLRRDARLRRAPRLSGRAGRWLSTRPDAWICKSGLRRGSIPAGKERQGPAHDKLRPRRAQFVELRVTEWICRVVSCTRPLVQNRDRRKTPQIVLVVIRRSPKIRCPLSTGVSVPVVFVDRWFAPSALADSRRTFIAFSRPRARRWPRRSPASSRTV